MYGNGFSEIFKINEAVPEKNITKHNTTVAAEGWSVYLWHFIY